MNATKYVETLEKLGKESSSNCYAGVWRECLESLHTPDGTRLVDTECCHTDCKTCIPCEQCGCKYDPSFKFSRHGPSANYEKWSEVYIAKNLHVPWYSSTVIKHTPYQIELLEPDAMVMIEDDIIDGLYALQTKYPNVVAWLTMEPLQYACLARMPKLVSLLTDWMERRNSFFTPSGEYAWMAGTNDSSKHYEFETRLDLPPIAHDGPHNIPAYLSRMDFLGSSINLAHGVEYILEKVKSTQDPYMLSSIYARAFASNTKFWQTLECSSMNNYRVLSSFIACISHYEKQDGRVITTKPDRWGGSTPFVQEEPKRLVWHTLKTRCSLCILDTHEGHTGYCGSCLHAVPTEPIAKSPYECVIAEAVAIRRRRLRGVLRCAAILVGKARQLHYMPPVWQILS